MISSDEIRTLSIAERILLVERIWDTIAEDGDAVGMPDSHRTELDRRLADHAARPEDVLTWDEVKARL